MNLRSTRPSQFRLGLGALLLAPLILGTSRPLYSETLCGSTTALPPGLEVTRKPVAFFGENVNNQGCSAPQRADVAVVLVIHNAGSEVVTLNEQGARLKIGAREFPNRPDVYDAPCERSDDLFGTCKDGHEHLATVPFRVFQIAPGATKDVRIEMHSVTEASTLAAASLEITVPTSVGLARMRFLAQPGVEPQPGGNIATWRPDACPASSPKSDGGRTR